MNAPLAHPNLSCRHVLDRLYEFIDGELTATVHEAVCRHLDICEGCSAELAVRAKLKAVVHRAFVGDEAGFEAPAMPAELRSRLADRLAELRDGPLPA
ncbi:MAG: zf-HC2 domain-containing protein [Bifidobacteriaceae bacterium]|jgi:anti-sigma factor (TIGR02949 family)|nr:zf-HC2 domain-containing protein [Bifidobacteriaceae bacterium]